MKLNSNQIGTLITAGVTLGTAVVTIGYSLYSSKKEKAEFEEYRKEKVLPRNFEKEIDDISITDDNLPVDLRVSLKRLLMVKKDRIDKATTKEGLASAILDFDLAMSSIAGKEGNAKTAAITYLVSDYENKLKLQEETRKEGVELQKYRAIGNEIVKAMNAAGVIRGSSSCEYSASNAPFITTDGNGVKKYWDGHSFWRV